MKVKMDPVKPEASRVARSISQKIEYADHYAELLEAENKSWGFRQLLNPEMLQGFTKFRDPSTGLECQAKIVECRWIEKGVVRDPQTKTLRESVRSVRVNPSELLEIFNIRVKECQKAKTKFRLSESDWFDYGMDAPGGHIPGVYIPTPPGPYTKQLYLQDRWQMMARCFEAKNHDPILHGAVAIITAFVVGDGVSIDSEDPRAQVIWDEFEERTELQRRLPKHCDMLSTGGNLFWWTPALKGQPGRLDFLTIDAGTVWEKITDPDDIRHVYCYWRQYPTAYQIYSVAGVPYVEYILDQVPGNEVIHITINNEESEKFGRSDLLAALSSSAMLRDIMRYRAIRTINESALCIDHTITGDDADVKRVSESQTSFLGPGTETYHSDKEKIEIHQWTGSGTQKSGLYDEMLGQIGQATMPPKEYIGGGDQGSRASALTATEPAAKLFRRRQTELEYPLMILHQKVIQEAKKYGLLPADCSEKCEVTFPELTTENKKERIGNIAFCEEQGYISHERAAEMCAKEIGVTTYDYQAEQETIAKDRANTNDPVLSRMYLPSPTNPSGPTVPSPQLMLPGGAFGGGSNKDGENMNGDTSGKSDQSKRDLRSDLKTRESVASGSMGQLLRKQSSKTYSIHAARFELARMRKAGFNLAEGDESVPAQWKSTVKKMLNHPEIDNPYALANWMDSQGYTPH